MLCKHCQVKVARNCVKAMGGTVPLNALPCDFEGHCDVEEYSKRIIEIFRPDRFSLKAEFGCAVPISFMTTEGIKRMEPGKSYDENFNEIK